MPEGQWTGDLLCRAIARWSVLADVPWPPATIPDFEQLFMDEKSLHDVPPHIASEPEKPCLTDQDAVAPMPTEMAQQIGKD